MQGGSGMSDGDPQDLGLLSKLAIALAVVFIATGIIWHGITVATVGRLWHDLVDRPDGPMAFRFIPQPGMATVAAIRDGRKDARANRTPYLATVLGSRQERMARLREGVNATARVFLLGIVMDRIYQALVLKRFYPNEAVVIALLLAFVPYVLIRGPVVRVTSAMACAASVASGRRRSSTYDGTRSSGQTKTRTPIGIGFYRTFTSSTRCRRPSRSKSRPS